MKRMDKLSELPNRAFFFLPTLNEAYYDLMEIAREETSQGGGEAGAIYAKTAQRIRNLMELVNQVAINEVYSPSDFKASLQGVEKGISEDIAKYNKYEIFGPRKPSDLEVTHFHEELQTAANALCEKNPELTEVLDAYAKLFESQWCDRGADEEKAKKEGKIVYRGLEGEGVIFLPKDSQLKDFLREIAENRNINPIELPPLPKMQRKETARTQQSSEIAR